MQPMPPPSTALRAKLRILPLNVHICLKAAFRRRCFLKSQNSRLLRYSIQPPNKLIFVEKIRFDSGLGQEILRVVLKNTPEKGENFKV